MNRVLGFVTWLNAVPGRKRGIAAALLGFGTSLRILGLEPYAQSIEGFNTFLQGLSTTTDIVGGLMGIWGLIHPLFISHQQLQVQAGNMMAEALNAMPPEQVIAKSLQADAIVTLKQAQASSQRSDAAVRSLGR